MHFLCYPPPKFTKMFWAHFLDFLDFCVQKRSSLQWSPDAFGGFHLKSSKKKFWAHFQDICVQKRRYFPSRSDAFWKFSACKFYRKSSGRNSTICASKNEAVCCKVQTHFGSPLPDKVYEKSWRIFSIFRPKVKLFAVEFRRSLEVFSVQALYTKFWVHFPIFGSKNEAVCWWVQTHFGRFRPARFMKKVLGAFSRFMYLKTKLFAVKFRRILVVLAQFHDLCVQNRSGLRIVGCCWPYVWAHYKFSFWLKCFLRYLGTHQWSPPITKG